MRWAALALAGLALTGCETTQEKSARLERAALHRAGASPLGSSGLKIARASTDVTVLASSVVHSREGTAVAITLRNRSATAQREVPLLVTVRGAGGATLSSNSTPGLARSLVCAGYVPAHGQTSWVDDQVQVSATPTSVTAEVGEGKAATGTAPRIVIGAHHLGEEPGGIAFVQGALSNRSAITQRELVVYALASKGGRIVAAGRAVLPVLAGGASSSFQIFLVGSGARGAALQLSAPPSTLG